MSSKEKAIDKEKKASKSNERSHRYSSERKTKSNSGGGPKKKFQLGDGKKDADDVVAPVEDETESPKTTIDEVVDEDSNKILKAEKQKQEEEEAKEKEHLKLEEEKKAATETEVSAEERIQNRKKLRNDNLNAASNRPNDSFFKGLDSSMKKNTTFVRKLRTMNEQQRDPLTAEFSGLNLSKFIQEAVTSIVEAKLKVADVSVAACLCSLFHQRYSEFTPLFKQAFVKSFEGINCKDEEKTGMVSRLRTSLRLLGELVLDGVFTSLDEGVILLRNIMQTIINSDKTSFTYAPVLLTIVRHCGEDLAGIIPRRHRYWKEKLNIELPTLGVISPEQQSIFLCLFQEYFESMSKHIVIMHKTLQNREKQNRQTIGLKGELPADRKESFEKAQKVYEKLLATTNSLAELLDEDMPDLPEDESEEREDLGTINIFTPVRGVEYDSENGLWEDEDTRTFYENLQDLKERVPQILFKDAPTSTSSLHNQKKKHDKKKGKERKLRVDINMAEDDSFDYLDELDDNYEQDVLGDDGDEDDVTVSGMAALAEAYFQKLPTCVNRDFIDQAAEEFIMKLNTKSNRKKLVRAVFSVNRVRLDLLPFYSRLVATLAPCLPEIGPDLVYLLKGSFLSHLRKKDQIHTESKIKTVRFLGELTKFKICPKAEALHCLKLLLDNFTHHQIDMACNLLETCGRYLYRSPESNTRMATLLEQMLRKKSVQAFDSRHVTMIENAFYYCNPPERQKMQRKVRPPLHEYIRKLLYKDLSKTTTEKVLRQMRKLPWKEEKLKQYATKCMVNVWNIKFNNVRCLANMMAGLTEYHDDVAVYVIDGVMENIRLGMETNVFRDNQRRLSTIKLLGEMYNYQLVDSEIIFSNLYLLVTFGACVEMSLSELDPPEHLFRIRLICTLLDTCGQYFDRGSAKKKMDYYLIFFQLYFWQKKESGYWNEGCPFPREVEYMVIDTIESMRPKLKLYSSMQEAQDAATELSKEYEDKIKAISSAEANETTDLDNSNLSMSPFGESPVACSPFGHSLSSQDEDEADESVTSGMESGEEGDIPDYDQEGYSEYDMNGDTVGMFAMDDEVQLREAPKYLECEEDEVFRKDFERLMGDCITERLNDNSKIPHVDIAIPMNLKGKQKKTSTSSETESNNGVNFVLMLKKNNKQVVKDLNIPLTSDLAANIRNKQIAERAEHEEMKRLVLDYNQRQEEESYNEVMSQNRPAKRGGYGHYRSYNSGGVTRTNRGGSQSRLRSRDAEQHLFSPSNRR